jgi:hypothetical protein
VHADPGEGTEFARLLPDAKAFASDRDHPSVESNRSARPGKRRECGALGARPPERRSGTAMSGPSLQQPVDGILPGGATRRTPRILPTVLELGAQASFQVIRGFEAVRLWVILLRYPQLVFIRASNRGR